MMELIIPDIFPKGVKALFTTKENHDLLYKRQPFPVYRPIQRHTPDVIILDGMERKVADGVLTDKKGIILATETADCVPILLCDPAVPVIGAVHAGWRGTALGIIRNAIKKMKEVFCSEPSRILIALGPSIHGCCYEVDEPVKRAICSQTGSDYEPRHNKYYIDLAHENLRQALKEGIREDNIWLSGECTYCNPERFHSYRHHGAGAGRQGGLIVIEI